MSRPSTLKISRPAHEVSASLQDAAVRALHPSYWGQILEKDSLARVARSLAEVVRHDGFDVGGAFARAGVARDASPDGGRRYCRIVDSSWLEVWIIEWGPATRLELHDHGGASGAVDVLDGELVETYASSFADGRSLSSRQLAAGTSFSFGPKHVHEVWNPAGAPALSLHAYSPRLSTMTFYAQANATLGALTRTELLDPAPMRPEPNQNSRTNRPRVPPASRIRWASAARSAGKVRATRSVTLPSSTC
jgi:predicted metal-dependent enzyme (double-stranded beta helix superfamily)